MAVERRPRSPVLDLSRPGGIEVEIDVSEAAEVLMSLCALPGRVDHDTFDLGAEWLRQRLDAVPADLLESIEGLGLGSMTIAAHLLGIVVETPQPRTFAAFLERLEATPPVEVKLYLFDYYGGSYEHLPAKDVLKRAAEGDERAEEELLARLAEYADKQDAFRNLIKLDAGELKARLIDLLPRWYEHVFLPYRQEWLDAAEPDAEAKRALARTHSPEQLTELALRGYQYTPAPGIRRLLFFPNWWMRPWVVLCEHKSTKVFCYPIAGGEREPDGSSPAELARIYKALGDEGRLRLLRRLRDGRITLTEAAAELGVAKSTAHHHLAILRQAGFVAVREEDDKVYTLRHDLLPQAGELLGAYLGVSRSSATSA